MPYEVAVAFTTATGIGWITTGVLILVVFSIMRLSYSWWVTTIAVFGPLVLVALTIIYGWIWSESQVALVGLFAQLIGIVGYRTIWSCRRIAIPGALILSGVSVAVSVLSFLFRDEPLWLVVANTDIAISVLFLFLMRGNSGWDTVYSRYFRLLLGSVHFARGFFIVAMDVTLAQPRTPFILLHIIVFAVATVALYTRAMEEKSRVAARHHALAMVGQFIDAWLAQLSHPFRKLVSAAADLDSYVIHAPALAEPEYTLSESDVERLHIAAEDIRAGTDRIGEQLVHLSQWSLLAETQSPDYALPELERIEYVPLHPTVSTVMDRLTAHISESFDKIGVHLAAVDIRVPLSRIEIEQIVENLVINAWHACAAGAPKGHTLYVRSFVNKTGNGIHLEVEDSGIGILTDDKENIFEPFFTTRETRGGTGLGLPIVRTLARNAGGDARVVFSEPGQTIVRVTLPFETE